MTTLNPAQMDEIAARHPAVFHRSFWQRFRVAIIAGSFLLYALYCWWFFAIGHVLGTANWNIAGTYLADWVSYEVRPEVTIAEDGAMKLTYPRFSPLGPDAKPDWVEIERGTMIRTAPAGTGTTAKKPASMGFMGSGGAVGGSAAAAEAVATATTREEDVVKRAKITLNASTSVEVVPERVTVQHAGETLVVDLERSGMTVDGTLPEWATQKAPGEKITLSFGFAGWGEIEADDISIRRRFLGWANFLFDTNSPFHGKPASEIVSLITSGERIDPKQSNLSLAWNNILYNAEWQHLDVWTKLLQTIVMAFVGTLFAMLLAFPLAFLAARNITRSWLSNQVTKRLFDFLRSVDMLIWALFFTRAFGPGPLAGMSAIFFTDTGTLGKLYSEASRTSTTSSAKVSNPSARRPSRCSAMACCPRSCPSLSPRRFISGNRTPVLQRSSARSGQGGSVSNSGRRCAPIPTGRTSPTWCSSSSPWSSSSTAYRMRCAPV